MNRLDVHHHGAFLLGLPDSRLRRLLQPSEVFLASDHQEHVTREEPEIRPPQQLRLVGITLGAPGFVYRRVH